jgi:hypothetical protein
LYSSSSLVLFPLHQHHLAHASEDNIGVSSTRCAGVTWLWSSGRSRRGLILANAVLWQHYQISKPVIGQMSVEVSRLLIPDVSTARLSWFYFGDDPPGDEERVRIPPAPSVKCSAGSGISGSRVAGQPGDGHDAA